MSDGTETDARLAQEVAERCAKASSASAPILSYQIVLRNIRQALGEAHKVSDGQLQAKANMLIMETAEQCACMAELHAAIKEKDVEPPF